MILPPVPRTMSFSEELAAVGVTCPARWEADVASLGSRFRADPEELAELFLVWATKSGRQAEVSAKSLDAFEMFLDTEHPTAAAKQPVDAAGVPDALMEEVRANYKNYKFIAH